MNRVIIPDNHSPAQPVPAPVPAATAAQPAAQGDARDALAGALPDWDLLPATPFIRRVK